MPTPLPQSKTREEVYREALEKIVGLEPCMQYGDCFYPTTDPEGNPTGEQQVDPKTVIQNMATEARTALAEKVAGFEGGFAESCWK